MEGMSDSRYIGVTMGCPVGIGPEIVLKFMAAPGLDSHGFRPVVVGDPGVLRRCARELKFDVSIIDWQPGEHPDRRTGPGVVPVMKTGALPPLDGVDSLRWGEPTLQTGRAMGGYIEEAVRKLRQGVLAAMVTCPISKFALQLGGYRFPGHTEMLAALSAANDYGMMMAGHRLRVSLVTIHTPLSQVAAELSVAEIARVIRLTGRTLQADFGIPWPRLAVAGLNPHAGEGGMFGAEEQELIAPAIRECTGHGWQVVGPLPPDTVFYRAAAGDFDAVICMYHDQGLIPFKMLHFSDGVNVTLGLPIVRTSVDHGTAYDIAGKGVADPASLRAAFAMAAQIVINRQKLKSNQ